MKLTECKAEVFDKNGEEYTRFTIGSKSVNMMLERLIVALGGKFTKETKRARYYEIKGNQIRLMALC